MRTTLVLMNLLLLLSYGCDGGGIGGLYGLPTGGGDTPDTGGDMDGGDDLNQGDAAEDQDAGAGTTTLGISFSPLSGFPEGEDPAEFDIGGGSVTTSGGDAETRGLLGLYGDDPFAWHPTNGGMGQITFNNLNVSAVDGYWVHPDNQAAGATMTVNFSGGGSVTVASAPVDAGGSLAQANGFFETVSAPDGQTITSLTFEFDAGTDADDVAALDSLELTVATP